MRLLVKQNLWKQSTDNKFVGDYMIAFGPYGASKSLDRGVSMKAGELNAGTRIRLREFREIGGGPRGSELRIIVEVINGRYAGLIADAASCVTYHKQPWWVKNCTVNPDELVFNEDIVRPCRDEEEQRLD